MHNPVVAVRRLLLIGAVCLFAACSTTEHQAVARAATTARPADMARSAEELCQDVLGPRALNSQTTTVGEVRHLERGGPPPVSPVPPPLADSFPGATDDAPAAWCWTKGSTAYELYAVGPAEESYFFEGVGGISPAPPPGPVPIP